MNPRLKLKLQLLAFLPLIFAEPSGAIGLEAQKSCQIPHLKDAIVQKVDKNGHLQLANGEIVRLIGIMPVKLIENPANSITKRLNKLARQSVEILRREVEGKPVRLYQNGRSHDRYDRLLAHVYGQNGQWLQGLLLKSGLARSFSYRDNHVCMKEMLVLEAKARKQRRGLWRYHLFAPQQALQQQQLSHKRYRFTLVEGRVRKVAVVKKWVFINFGDNWRDDFSIAIKRKYKKTIARRGLDLEKLTGRKIRVRGWIESWNGPLIKVTHNEQIELLDED